MCVGWWDGGMVMVTIGLCRALPSLTEVVTNLAERLRVRVAPEHKPLLLELSEGLVVMQRERCEDLARTRAWA